MNKRIGKEAKKLLLADLIYILTGVFINTFLVAYFLEITNDNITKVALYYLTVHSIRFIGSLVIGEHIKKHPEITKQVLSLSVITRAIFILFIVVLKENIINNYIWVAGVYSMSEILYWSTHEMMYIGLTNNNNRKEFMATKKVLDKIINIIAPIVLGTSIELASFNDIAIYVFILATLEILITLYIKQPNITKDSKTYNMQAFKLKIKEEDIEDVNNFAKAGVIYGVFEKTISKIIIVITLMTFKTQVSLGVLTTVFSLCSMFAIIIYNKLDTKKTYKSIFNILSIAIILSVVGLFLDINKTTLIIYNFCYMVGFGIYDVVYNIKKANIVVDNELEEYKEEYLAYVTASISLGRIIGYGMMLVAGLLNSIIFFKLLLLVTTIAIPIFIRYLIKLEQNSKVKELSWMKKT